MLGVSNFPSLSLANAKVIVEVGQSMSGSSGGCCFGVTEGRAGWAVKCKERGCSTGTTFVGKVPESCLSSVKSREKHELYNHARKPPQMQFLAFLWFCLDVLQF